MNRSSIKAIKYLPVSIFLIVLLILATGPNTQKIDSSNGQNLQTQENNEQNGPEAIICNDNLDTDELSMLVDQPKEDSACLNIGCASFF